MARLLWGFAAFLMIGSSICRGDSPPTTAPAGKLAPALQKAPLADRGRKVALKRIAWYVDQMLGAYQHAGRKNPKWDADAEEILTCAARVWSNDPARTGDEEDIIVAAWKRAAEAGCDDPLVMLAAARMDTQFGRDFRAINSRHLEATRAMTTSKYHALLRCQAQLAAVLPVHERRIDLVPHPDPNEPKRLMDAALALLPEIAADPNVPRADLLDLLDRIADCSKIADPKKSPMAFLVPAVELVEKHCPDQSTVLTARAIRDYERAWEARGEDWAHKVERDAWPVFDENLRQAADACEQAWALDDTNSRAAVRMLSIDFGMCHGREVFDLWFDRATAADPFDFEPYRRKMYFLEPKWGGSHEAMHAFADEVLENPNWEARAPLIVIDMYETLSEAVVTDRKNPRISAEERIRYHTSDPKIWKDFEAVYTGLLVRLPSSTYHRSKYAKDACWMGHFDIAAEQFKILGEHYSPRVFNPKEYASLRQVADLAPQMPDVAPADAQPPSAAPGPAPEVGKSPN